MKTDLHMCMLLVCECCSYSGSKLPGDLSIMPECAVSIKLLDLVKNEEYASSQVSFILYFIICHGSILMDLYHYIPS